MQKNSQNFSMQDAVRLAGTDAGQQLLRHLQQTQGDALQKAAAMAAAGDCRRAGASLAPLLESPEVRAMLRQLEK
jgi:hypothetical protein